MSWCFICAIYDLLNRWASTSLGINMEAKVEKTMRRSDWEGQLIGEPTGERYDVVLFFGIIDILQDYDISKKLEHAYKSMQYDPTSISAVDPKQYSKRFRDFVFKVFVEDTWKQSMPILAILFDLKQMTASAMGFPAGMGALHCQVFACQLDIFKPSLIHSFFKKKIIVI